MKLLAALMLCVLTFASVTTSALSPLDNDAGSGGDAGDAPESALPVAPDVTFTGRLTRAIDEADHYAFMSAGSQAFVPSQRVVLIDSVGGARVAQPPCDFPVIQNAGRATFSLQLGDLLKAPIQDYSFSFSLVDIPAHDDAGSGSDAGASEATAVALPDGLSHGFAGFDDTADTFTFAIAAGETVRMTLTTEIFALEGFYQPGVSTSIDSIRGGTSYTAPVAGNVFISLLAECGGGPYSILLERL